LFSLNCKIISYFFDNCLIVFDCFNCHWPRHILVCLSIETFKLFLSALLLALWSFSQTLILKWLLQIFLKIIFLFFLFFFCKIKVRIILLILIFNFFIFTSIFFYKNAHFIRPKNFYTNQNRSSFFSLKNSCLLRRYMKDTIISCWVPYKR
jgi:hypothetical protein